MSRIITAREVKLVGEELPAADVENGLTFLFKTLTEIQSGIEDIQRHLSSLDNQVFNLWRKIDEINPPAHYVLTDISGVERWGLGIGELGALHTQRLDDATELTAPIVLEYEGDRRQVIIEDGALTTISTEEPLTPFIVVIDDMVRNSWSVHLREKHALETRPYGEGES